MTQLNEQDIRASFVNCSKGEATRLAVPRDLSDLHWSELDFLGWTDAAAPGRGYLVTERDDRLVGVALRFPSDQSGLRHSRMCSLCLTTHSGGGVSLMVARKTGASGRNANTIGLYACTDLACSQYLRGTKKPGSGTRMEESLTLEQQTERTMTKLFSFLDRLAA